MSGNWMIAATFWLNVIGWPLEVLILYYIWRQGEILVRNDQERIQLDRRREQRETERYQERAQWREDKRKALKKKSESSASEPSKSTALPLPNMMPSSPLKMENAPSAEDLPQISQSI
jgi:hypothetical protein